MKKSYRYRFKFIKYLMLYFYSIFVLMACSHGNINKISTPVGLYSYKNKSIEALVRTGKSVCYGSTFGEFVGRQFKIVSDNRPMLYYIGSGGIDKAFLNVLSKHYDSVSIVEREENCKYDYCFSVFINEFNIWKANTSVFNLEGSFGGVIEVTKKGGGIIKKVNFYLSNPKVYSGKGCGIGYIGSTPFMNVEGLYDYSKDIKYIINNLLADYDISKDVNFLSLHSLSINNDRATMESNRVVWEYDLENSGTEVVVVELSVIVSGKTYLSKDLHLEGDVGKVTPGKGKKIWWNVLRDFPRGLDTKVDWELSAEVAR